MLFHSTALSVALLALPALGYFLRYEKSPNGFETQIRGWSSFTLSKVGQVEFTQDNVIKQCDAMSKTLGSYGYRYCNIDSSWSIGDHGDEYGRIMYDEEAGWDVPALASHLHDSGMLMGIYILPGYFHNDENSYIYGTNPPIQLKSIGTGECTGFSRCSINYSAPGAQEWCNSNVNQFAEWGVDYIKLDYVTPGQADIDDKDYDHDTSGSVICYHEAIQQSSRQMYLDLSYKLEWEDERYYDIWKNNADSFRIDQDNNNQEKGPQTNYDAIQRTIDQYRRYSLTMYSRDPTMTIRPNFDSLDVGNSKSLSGLTDNQRRIMYAHWIGAGAPLLLGSDMTKLDNLGESMLTNSLFNEIVNGLTYAYPILPDSVDLDYGVQIQLWIAGPDPIGQALLIWVNYGSSNPQYYSDSPQKETNWQLNNTGFQGWGLDQPCYKGRNLFNPSNDPDLQNFNALKTQLKDEQIVVLLLQPNQQTECGWATAVR